MKRLLAVLGVCSMLAIIHSAIPDVAGPYQDMIVAHAEETVYEYRSCKKNYITSETRLGEPYVYVSEKQVDDGWGDWSSWSTTQIASSATRDVQTETRQGDPTSYVMINYRTRGDIYSVDDGYYRITGNGVNVRSEPTKDSVSFGLAYNDNTTFVADDYSGNWVHTPSIHTSNGVTSGWISMSFCAPCGNYYVQYRDYSVNGDYDAYDLQASWGEHGGEERTIDPAEFRSARTAAPWSFVTGMRVYDDSYNVDGYNMTDKTGYVLNDGYADMIWFVTRINYSQATYYRYRDRSFKTVYTYYSLGEWSEWSITPIEPSDGIVVEKREVVPAPTEPTTEATTSTSATSPTEETATTEATPTIKSNEIQPQKDHFSFLNRSEYFHPTYRISDRYLTMLGNSLSNIEWESLSSMSGGGVKWDGSCYGMSVVQILAKDGILKASSVDKNANWIYDWKAPVKDENVESLINYYHMLQYSDVFKHFANQFTKYTNKKQVDALIQMATDAENGGDVALVCFLFTKQPSDKLGAGHAVVAYGIEYGTWTYKNKYNCRILVSDPNVSGFADDCCIYIDTNTYKWEIPYYQSKYYSCTNDNQNKNDNPYARFRLVTNDIKLLDTFGFLRKEGTVSINSTDSTVDINSGSNDFNVAFYDENQTDGLSDAECELIYYSGLLDSNATSRTISAILPKADTPYEFFEKDLTAFDTSIKYTDSMLNATASRGLYAIYKPDECVEFHGKNSEYDLSMIMNSGHCSTDWHKIHVSGVNSDNGTLKMVNNGYIISSDGLADGVFIAASNRNHIAKLGIITEYDSVFVYEIDEDTIGIKTDQNKDGIYETRFSPDYLGDVDSDSSVSVSDIVKMQRYLLKLDPLDRKQYICGDINLDGTVDVFDIALLKRRLLDYK